MKNYAPVEDENDVATKGYVDRRPVVSYQEQALTAQQQAQARKNIGAEGANVTVVKWGT